MSSKPLSYESLKTVLQYTEANLRYQMSCQIPSIRTVEKLVPLKFDSLEFDNLRTRLNRTAYGLGVYRQYHDGQEVPKYHETDNAAGGTPYDIIEHGFEEVTYNGDSTPGDVDIRFPGSEKHPLNRNRVIGQFEDFFVEEIELYGRIVAIKQSDELAIARGEDPMVNHQDDRRIYSWIFEQTVEHLREKIQYFRTCLIPHRCRRGNIPLSFTPFIQLTIRSPAGVRVYRHSYTMKLNQAMKKLNTAFFGARKHVLRSRVLFIAKPLIVIRLPEGVRMRIRELKVTGDVDSNYEALKLIVEEASYPLNSMTVYNVSPVPNHFGHSIVKCAKTLTLKSNYRIERSHLPLFLRHLKNKIILVDCIRWLFPVQDQISLVEDWLNEDKAVGTSLYYDVKEEETATQVLDEIARQFNGIRQFDNIVGMPMKNGNRLEVSYALIVQSYNLDVHQKFRMKMKVVAAEEDFF